MGPQAMSTPIHYYLPREIEGIESLLALALDLRWSWNHAADEIWRQLDPELLALTHNPWVVLQAASRTKLHALRADPAFREKVAALVRTQQEYLTTPAWFQQAQSRSPLTCVAYFSRVYPK
jgi:glycogen phosphorylase